MKTFFLILYCVCISLTGMAQRIDKPASLQPPGDFEHIHVEKFGSDANMSSFIIWVKESVPAHKHEGHSEIVYVLEGSGEMWLGDKIVTVSSGDCIFIPKGTVHAVRVNSTVPMKVLSIQSPEFDGSDRVPVPLEW